MKPAQHAVLTLTVLYALYLVKTALGINFSDRYHADDMFKLPLRAIVNSRG